MFNNTSAIDYGVMMHQAILGELTDGIYFGMPDEIYHAIPRLSASGIKQLLISPMDFWAWSWMNPLKERNESEALQVGKAYHTRILEGSTAFYLQYAPEYIAPVDVQFIDTIDDCKKALEEHGIKPHYKWKKEDFIEAVKELNAGYEFKDEHELEYKRQFPNRKFLSRRLIAQIEIAAAMVERHTQLSKSIVGGYPEVTILWTCKETGVQMKARLDYLKIKAITDLKTFTNKLNKAINKALYHAVASYKYHVQSGVYYEAVDYAREFAATGLVFGEVDSDWINQFAAETETTFLFIFQQKGIAPVTRGKIMPKTSIHDLAKIMIREAKDAFVANFELFGTDPWHDSAPVDEFNDNEFPAYINDL